VNGTMTAQARRVLMLVENLSVPTDPRVWNEAQALREIGYEVSVISPMGDDRDLAPHEVIDGIHVYRFACPAAAGGCGGYVREYAVAVVKTMALSLKVWRRHGIDAVHAENPPDTFFVIGLFYKLFGKRYVFDQQDLAPELFRVRFRGRLGPLFRPLHRVLEWLEACSYRVADAVITSNESQRAIAIDRGRCRPEKVSVVRNGPRLHGTVGVPADPALKGGTRYRLAYLGVMGVQDGVEYALHALHELVVRRGRGDVSLVLMGDGDERPRLQALARELGLDDRVTFTGWVDREELLRHLAASDIGLTPDPSNELSDRSTFLKTMDYMAMGKPGVAFDSPETRYSAGDAALYATPNLVESFADRIETLLDDENLRASMGGRGRRRVEEELCWDRVKPSLARTYEKLFPADSRSLPVASQRALARRGKRLFDVMGSATLLVLSAPLLGVIAILVKTGSRGPVLYRQTRVGLGGRRFVMYKFRSMYDGVDSALHRRHTEELIRGRASWIALSHDPRITPVGRLLRRLSLDELPQLFNVLRGDMSLVGPRPALPYEVALYEPWHHQRFAAPPGITGPWQVRARNGGSFDDMVRADLDYLRSRSLWLDLKLLAQTPLAALVGKGIE